MKKLLLLFIGVSLSFAHFSQDTTWVKTFTFDSITTRRANFTFPEELNSKRFEKVLMYYMYGAQCQFNIQTCEALSMSFPEHWH